ncbi:hypothetical protein [Acinetobacter pragensis]|uniref:hypothetical protein n=1 Tax=Acinetobacter pragensis TaxID=1806892 RepID=UPI003342AE8D
MADLNRKRDTIRSIETLQLTENLIAALDNAAEAESVAKAVCALQHLTEQWN